MSSKAVMLVLRPVLTALLTGKGETSSSLNHKHEFHSRTCRYLLPAAVLVPRATYGSWLVSK